MQILFDADHGLYTELFNAAETPLEKKVMKAVEYHVQKALKARGEAFYQHLTAKRERTGKPD